MKNRNHKILGINKVTEKIQRLNKKKHSEYNPHADIVNKDFIKPEIEIYNDLKYATVAYINVVNFIADLDIDYQEQLAEKDKIIEGKNGRLLYLGSEIDKLKQDHKKEIQDQANCYEDYIKELEDKVKELEDKINKFSRKKSVTKEQQQIIKDKVANGMTYRQVSKEEGVSTFTISRIINNTY